MSKIVPFNFRIPFLRIRDLSQVRRFRSVVSDCSNLWPTPIGPWELSWPWNPWVRVVIDT